LSFWRGDQEDDTWGTLGTVLQVLLAIPEIGLPILVAGLALGIACLPFYLAFHAAVALSGAAFLPAPAPARTLALAPAREITFLPARPLASPCPYCGTHDAEPSLSCRRCHVPHHEACWEENGGCTVYACAETRAA
jgi:hypothetical protein